MNNIELGKKVKSLVHSQAYHKGYACSVEGLLQLGYLTPGALESWRFGKTAYLERVCTTNLAILTTINKIIRKTANELQLVRSFTAYHSFGKGPRRQLYFSKSGDKKLKKLTPPTL